VAREGERVNTKHIVKVEAPLLRPGLTISAECSEKYVIRVSVKLVELAREVNKALEPKIVVRYMK